MADILAFLLTNIKPTQIYVVKIPRYILSLSVKFGVWYSIP